jgi:hypothetical protein
MHAEGIFAGHYETAVEHIQRFYKEVFVNIDDLDDVYIEMVEAVEAKLKSTITKKV